MLTTPLQPAEGRAKYMQVRDALYEQITQSNLQPGEKLWTESDLIASLGVSITTVRKAIDELARLGIVERRVGRGTFLKALPAPAETSLTSNCVSLLGFQSWQGLLHDPYYGEILHALDTTLQEAGLQLQVSTRQWGSDTDRDLRDLVEQKPAALIFPFSDITKKHFVFKLQTLGLPLLLLNHGFAEYDGPLIGVDNPQSGRLAAEHLLQRGHRRFAVLAGPQASPNNPALIASFRKTLAEAGFSLPPENIYFGDYAETSGYRGTQALLERDPVPTGIFCCSDVIAYGAIKCLEERGRRVPDDVAILGVGGFRVSSLYYPHLTTLELACQPMGCLAGQWARHVLGREAAGWHPAQPIHLMPTRLRQGETT